MDKLRVLVADDEAIIRLGLRSMLAKMGHEVLLAADGREALNLARASRPDIALLDIRMPNVDGLEVARTLNKRQAMPIILLTAYSEQDQIQQATELQVQSYLIKPVDERDLTAAIPMAVARFKDSQAAQDKIADLQETIETRKLIDRAKGVLMARDSLSEDQAYHRLQKRARDERISMRTVAEDVLRRASTIMSAVWLPFDLVIFDCDSTLSTVEGIDELARWQGKAHEIEALTQAAMNGELDLSEVYSRRLEILNPTRDHIERLGRLYVDTLVPDAREVVAGLQAAGCKVFIVSGGLAAGVRAFGLWLGIPDARIHAVELEYNQLAGRWWETWTHPGGRNVFEQVLAHDGGPLTIGKGKADIIRRIRSEHAGRAMLIGDGTSDLEAAPEVDLFVGFGGVVSRDKVRAVAPAFIHTLSLAPILPMALARSHAPPGFEETYARGIAALEQGDVTLALADARLALLQRIL